ncbi:MAG: hypothetical protein DRH08_01355 [Deltaproteobacteria bacterium]|nr:MAG: hypothetical protein DRH08_01355 [Deltaproteobacteria bacterium]
MKASVANYLAVTEIVRFCKSQHVKSSWAEIDFNPVLFKRNMVRVVREDGSDILIVRDDTDRVVGVLLATVDQFIFNKMVYATDIHFMCEAGGIEILGEFKRWAREHRASKIIMGIANEDPTGKVHMFYKLSGFRSVGDAWVMDLQEAQEKAA